MLISYTHHLIHVHRVACKIKGLLASRLKQEIDLVQAVSVGERVDHSKEVALQLLQTMLEWEAQIEAALEECGVNMKLSEEGIVLLLQY